jgi:peptidyl-prolyl cis-trans isomerase B (cyclophilin B)
MFALSAPPARIGARRCCQRQTVCWAVHGRVQCVRAAAGSNRRQTLLATGALLLTLRPLSAEAEAEAVMDDLTTSSEPQSAARPSARVFFELTIDGEPLGRVVVGLNNSASPLAAKRFLELATGAAGVSYRRTAVDSLQPSFVKTAGVRRFSYAEDTIGTTLAGGETARLLQEEAAAVPPVLHSRAGLVSLLIAPLSEPEAPKERLVASRGKLITVQDAAAPQPNGTEWLVTLGPAPALDDGVAVVVGEVLEGMDLVQAIAALPANRNADEAGALFAVAKAIGDKRALVRGKASGKPLSRVVIAACGLVG